MQKNILILTEVNDTPLAQSKRDVDVSFLEKTRKERAPGGPRVKLRTLPKTHSTVNGSKYVFDFIKDMENRQDSSSQKANPICMVVTLEMALHALVGLK